MSDDTEMEAVLRHLQTALDSLDKCGDLDSTLSKVEANPKLLKKAKSLSASVHLKISSIKDSVSRSYRKVKVQGSSGNLSSDDGSTETGSVDNGSGRQTEASSEKTPQENNNSTQESSVVTVTDSDKGEQTETPLKENNNSSRDGSVDKLIATLEGTDVTQSESHTETHNGIEIPLKVPKIKLVDINKLLAPNVKGLEMTPPVSKSQKSVSFDSSIILLTSSDDECLKRPNHRPKRGSKGLSQKPGSQRNSESKRKSLRVKNADNSDTDSDATLARTTRTTNKKNKVKEKFTRLVKERNATKRRKKDLLEESSLSEGSSDESEALSATRRGRLKITKKENHHLNAEPWKDDPKLKAPVYIPLPRLKCEDLEQLYRHKRALFEIKRLCKLPSGSCKKGDSRKDKVKLASKSKSKKAVVEKSSESSSEISSDGDHHEDVSDVVTVPQMDQASVDSGLTSLAEACLDQVTDHSDKELETGNQNVEVEDQLKELESDQNKETDKENKETDEEIKETDKESKEAGSEKESDVEKSEGVPEKEATEPEKAIDKDKEIDNKEKSKATNSTDRHSVSITDSDSDDVFAKFSAKNIKQKKELVQDAKKKASKRKNIISDSDEDGGSDKEASKDEKSDNEGDQFKPSDKGSESEDSDKESGSEKKDESSKSAARKRIKRVRDSSSEDDDKSTRKQIRRMIDKDSLSETTKKAEQDEKDRKQRIAEKQKKYNQIFELKADATVDKVVLDFDEKTNEPLLSVHKKMVKHLKPHQVHGVKFMWDATFESLARAKEGKGSGCILAHCMGLGKTLQVITLVHTLMLNSEITGVERVMVVCPVNTVLNWKNEFKKWMPKSTDIDVYELVTCKTSSINQERNYIVRCWHDDGGVLIIGYNMFRNLSNPDNKAVPKKLRDSFKAALVDPGPDLVVCDEGHLLKNEKTNLSIAMNRIKTARRIVLTGTPLQNNLREYWCMVQFIKPNLLGSYKEYMNRFVNPITNGQYTDSTQHDIQVMRRRSHVLHKLLDGVVQRQDYAVLEPYLPPKHEYVVFIQLSEVQVKLYRHYMEHLARRGEGGSNRTSFLFADFQELQRICTHPRVLLDKSLEVKSRKELEEDETESEGSLKDFIDDGSEEDSSSSSKSDDTSSDGDSDAAGSGSDDGGKKKRKKKESAGGRSRNKSGRKARLTRAQAAQNRENGDKSDSDVLIADDAEKHWWEEYISREELDNVNHGSKIFLLFQILKECEEIGDKVLVFSQSLYTLNCIEYFLARIDEATQKGESEKVGGHAGSWALGLDYFRLDGSSSCDNRASWCDEFNDPENIRARLFLISTKAGGLGINLVAANRVIIFDVSWNPSHDIQSIYRVYRFGQTKPSYIYRFVTYGTMEMKVYERQVTKQAISKRVIDEQQIDRHYSQNDIQELYKSDLEPKDRAIPLVPKDVLLGEMLQKYESVIFKYHEHQSLLENKQDEELNEEERKAAWDEFENEKVLKKTTVTNFGSVHLGAIYNSALNFSPQAIQIALGNIVRRDNPGWSDVQIRGVIPALVTQLQVQMSENDFSMYSRVQHEIRLMQMMHQQRMLKQYMEQQKQQRANQLLGNLSITPEELRRLQMGQQLAAAGGSGGDGEIIDLND